MGTLVTRTLYPICNLYLVPYMYKWEFYAIYMFLRTLRKLDKLIYVLRTYIFY